MQKWIVTTLAVLGLAGLAATAQLWLPPFLSFVGANSDLIQGLSNLTQLISWLCTGIVLLVGLWRTKKTNSTIASHAMTTNSVKADHNSVTIDGNVRNSNINTGSGNIIGRRIGVSGDVVGRDKITNINTAPVATINSLHQLPPPPRDFTGRTAEVDELMRALQKDGVTISGLYGMDGIGKTTLALKLAERLTPSYPDAQFFLDLKGVSSQPLTSAEAMAYVIRAYHPASKFPENENEMRGLYHSVLHGQRALLLLDNARDARQVEPLLPPASCCLLVTSRQHFTLPGLFAKNLDILPPENACELLLTIAPRISEQAEVIAKLCDYLPLALRLAGSALAERINLSPEDYACRLMNAQTRFEGVDASLNLSHELLDAPIQKLWRLLAVFPDTFDQAAAAAVWNIDLDQAQDTLSTLVAYSLVDWQPANRRYRLHDLARLFAENHCTEYENMINQQRHAQYYLEVLQEVAYIYEPVGICTNCGFDLFDLEWENILAGQVWATSHTMTNDIAAKLCNSYPTAGASLLDLRLHPYEHVHWLEAALVAAQKLKDRSSEGLHLGNLGLVYFRLGYNQKAVELSEHALAIARICGDRRNEGAWLGNLGSAYAELGELRKAIEYNEQALRINREIGYRRGVIADLSNLGIVYKELGEVQKAIELHEQSLLESREIGDLYGESIALGNLSNIYSSLRKTHTAISLYKKCLTLQRKVPDFRGEGKSLGNLGNCYRDHGWKRKAISFYKQAWGIAHESCDLKNEAIWLDNIGLTYSALGQPRKAIVYHEQRLTVLRNLGDRHGEGIVFGNLGITYYIWGEFKKALEFYEQKLSIIRELCDSHEEGSTLFNMSLALYKLGYHSHAIDHANTALKILEQNKDPNVEKVCKRLAICCSKAGKKRWQFWK